MGTFHDDRGALHGITVLVETSTSAVIGRCDTVSAEEVLLWDADVHEGDAAERLAWLEKAARFGVWPRHQRLRIPRGEVVSIRPLADVEPER